MPLPSPTSASASRGWADGDRRRPAAAHGARREAAPRRRRRLLGGARQGLPRPDRRGRVQGAGLHPRDPTTTPPSTRPRSTGRCRRCADRSRVFPSPSRTTWSPRASPPRAPRRSCATTSRSTRPRPCARCGRTTWSCWARPTSTSSPWARARRTRRTRSRPIRGTSPPCPAAAAAALPPPWPPARLLWALGSDTGGSIRQPAALCGIVGMKPTYGAVSRYGLIAFASSLDQIGPLTRSVYDCALLLQHISGRDLRDSTSVELPEPVALPTAERLDGLRVGVPSEYLAAERSSRGAGPLRRDAGAHRGARRARASRSACRTRSTPCRRTTSSLRPRRARTSPASTASATATAAPIPSTCAISTSVLAGKGSVRRSSAAS